MKKLILLIPLLSLLFSVNSCDESFSPVAEFRERNILFSTIQCDTSFQSVILSKSYKLDELETYDGNAGKTIEGADVKIWYKGDVFQFRDTILSSNSNPDLKYHAYYNKELNPESGEFLDIEALLPNGLLLQSVTKTPSELKFFSSSTDKDLPSTKHPPYLFFEWNNEQNNYYLPQIFVEYYNYSSGTATLIREEWPIDLQNNTPVFAEPSPSNSLSIDMETIETLLRRISVNDPKKDNYRIMEIYLEIVSLDYNFSAYVAATKNFSTDFTVKLDAPDFTNIDGGLGLFGSYSVKKYDLLLNKEYIKSYGYLVTY